jgi:RNA polymerase sigma factor (sigma-70 family)
LSAIFKDIHQDLIDECKAGSSAAQFKIYKLYYKAMYNTCLRIVNDTAEAEDIMQEAFLDAFRKIGSYTGEGSFGSWLKRIVINKSLDFLRRSKDLIPLDETRIDLPAEEEPVSEEDFEFQVNEIKAAIKRLPDEYRVVMTLFLLEGYSHEEISRIIGISNNNSRTRYSRARQKLISMLKEQKEFQNYSRN